MDEDAEFSAGFYGKAFARFDELGEDSVSRLLFSGGITLQDREAAFAWLGLKSKKKAREVRWINIRSYIALAISAISLAFTFIKLK